VAVDGYRFQVGHGIEEESSPRVHFDTWAGGRHRAASGGTYRKSGMRGARVSLDFRGRSLTWVTATGPSSGRARVVIDGRAHRVDLYSAARHWRVPLRFAGLGSGEHHLTITALGTKSTASRSTTVAVDALVVRRR
jgi:hypothetical protein